MLPTCHDHRITSYRVDCDQRAIVLQGAEPNWAGARTWAILITDVAAYSLKNDAFGNIILRIAEVPFPVFYSQFRSELVSSYQTAGAGGAWAIEEETARAFIEASMLKCVLLEASIGLDGWILAGKFEFSISG